ncbi:MAG: T9SS type A sorting domain-containing protein [Sphingobacteriales bacterium]|nr:T9SS type A sorting domain-containing protein [Sphingobacteriales bacterium]
MKTPKPTLLAVLMTLHVSLSAQVQWYQNQDGNNQLPTGTIGTSVQSFTPNSFVACYLWRTENDTYTWKISKTHINGAEQKTKLISGTSCMTEIKVSGHNSIYVLQKNFPIGQNPEYLLYKLDSNLNIKKQRFISFPNNFSIFNLGCFELDRFDNVYLAGDGQYPNGPGFSFASFVIKTDKNLTSQWSRVDSFQTSYTRLHIDRWGRVTVIEDYYGFFPDLHIKRISPNGQYVQNFTIETNPGRYSLFSTMDEDDNLFIYGNKSVGDTAQAMYLYKLSRINMSAIYRKTLFKAPGSQINDIKVDRHNKIFALLSMYTANGIQLCRISRINSNNGNIVWNHSMPFAQDSCNFVKLVMGDNDRMYAIGQRMSHTYFSKGFAMRMRKSGQMDGEFPSPDSVAYQRLHWLAYGITDRNNQLIAIGGTSDLDTISFMNTYLRAFAVRYGNNGNCNLTGKGEVITESDAAEASELNSKKLMASPALNIYPNPVQSSLTISGLQQEGYDKLTVLNMQGAMVLQLTTNSNFAHMDINDLPDGVYLLVLRSSVSLKEKSMKFVVRK